MTKLQNISGITVSLLALILCSTYAPPAVCIENNNNTLQQTLLLSELEHKLFFKTYAHNTLTVRLERLERQVFGEPMPGSVNERLIHLSALRPTGSDNVTHTQNATSTPIMDNCQSRVAATTTNTMEAGLSNSEEQVYTAERARIAVMAAKEDEVRTLLSSGVELWRAGRRKEALEKFEQVIRLDSANAEAHYSKGIIEESQGNLAEALSSYQLAVQARPQDKEYFSAVTEAQKKLASKQKVDAKPAALQHLAQSALNAYKRGEYLSALDLYKALDRKAPNQHQVKYNIGTIYLMLKVPEKALEYYKQAHKLNPSETRYLQGCKQLEQVIANNTT